MSKPTIHVTNWSSRKLHGPGRKFTIMAFPRAWEHGDGYVNWLIPDGEDLRMLQNGQLLPVHYFRRYDAKIRKLPLDECVAPDALFYNHGSYFDFVKDGDTLCCGCGVGKPCHRVSAAKALHEAGWRVILDGQEVQS